MVLVLVHEWFWVLSDLGFGIHGLGLIKDEALALLLAVSTASLI